MLEDVSLELRAGEVLVLLGPNGAGKTSLIRALNGTVATDSGEILINGSPATKLSRKEIAKNIAVVAQENETKFPLTVMEFVLAGRFVHGGVFGWETGEDMASAEDALEQCDLSKFRERLMNEISGGERQRVVLARALATGAKALLLDEPTANLDLAHQALMFRLVRSRCHELGHSAVVITHDLNIAAEFGDELMLLRDGRVLAKGKSSEVLTDRNLRAVFGVKVLLDENPASGRLRVTTVY